MNKEEQILLKHLRDLAFQADKRNYTAHSEFLNMNEQTIFFNHLQELPPIHYELWGGYAEAERKVIAFSPMAEIEKEEYEIMMLEIAPAHMKFADQLTHRDFLGAILNLGIERGRIGDILLKDNNGYVFTDPMIGEYIASSLTRIKHTTVTCTLKAVEEVDIKPEYKEMNTTISATRLDAIIAAAFKTSRSSMTGLIAAGKVFVNGKLIESNSYVLKEEDIVSVRGFGKFIFKGINKQTKKGRLSVTFLIYI